MKKVLFSKLEAGQEFAYRGNYYVKDYDHCSVKLTGRYVGEIGHVSNDDKVRLVTLLVEEEN